MYFVSEVMEAKKKKKMGRSHFPKIRGFFFGLDPINKQQFPFCFAFNSQSEVIEARKALGLLEGS